MIPQDLFSWFNNTKVSFSYEVEGNDFSIKPDKFLVLGGRSGPESNISSLIHEMSHFIEIDDKRCLMKNWGLKIPQKPMPFPDKYRSHYNDPQTYQATIREIRVYAISLIIANYYNIKLDDYGDDEKTKNLLGHSLARYMPDYFNARTYFNLPDLDSSSLEEYELALDQKIDEDIRAKAEKLNINDLYNEWERKCKIHDDFVKENSNKPNERIYKKPGKK